MIDQTQAKPLYIVLICVHGLVRSFDLELGRDVDTGGQTKYVVELARALAKQPGVDRVVLVTRQIFDNEYGPSYAEPVEFLAENAQIVRIPAGPLGHISKEDLWDHLDSFADNLLDWLQQESRLPDLFHSHYADSGYVGVRLSQWTGLPLVHTGHSLGRDKLRQLLAVGLPSDEIEERYHIFRRISAEEDTLTNADLIITSTRNEIEDQYELYDCYNPEKMAVIPPGTDLEQFHPPKANDNNIGFGKILAKFLHNPDKPIILALSRPDERKNINTLLEAYGESVQLQELANLVIVAGNRDDIRELNEGAQAVLTEILLVIDCYDLYGKVALPKHHKTDEVADIYRLVALSKGVFVNPALTEPFGLTLLEAAASGVPIVATENGGPNDIIGNCQNGLLVDPLDKSAIAEALLSVLEHPEKWQQYSDNGIKNVTRYYSWDAHAQSYLHNIAVLSPSSKILKDIKPTLPKDIFKRQAIFTAVDNTLLGEAKSLAQLVQVIRERRKKLLFGIATGRRLDSVLSILKIHHIPMPDILITSLGTEIYVAPRLMADITWTYHIDHMWTPQVLRRILGNLPGLKPQAKHEQSRFKVSYYYDSQVAPSMEEILTLLRQHELVVNPILSFGQFLDFIPARASKGQAVRYVARQWHIPLEQVLVTGGSGGDEDMLRGNTLGVVVANRHSEELDSLGDTEHVYYAEHSHAGGILEAIRHYGFFNI